MKKLFDFLLVLAIVAVVVVWVYRLSLLFYGLPETELSGYVYFIVELWVFTFFLVASGMLSLWLWKGEKGNQQNLHNLAKEVKRLSLLLDHKDFQLQQAPADDKDVRRLEVFLRPLKASNPAEWATQVIEGCFVLSGARRISVFLSCDGGEYALEKSMGLPNAKVGQRLIAEDLAFQVLQKQKRLFVTEIETHPEIARQNRLGYASHSFLILPIMTYQRKVLGVVNLTEKENGLVFTSVELEMLCHLITVAAYQIMLLSREDVS